MATLSAETPCFTVMVSVAVPPSHRDELVAIMLETTPVFAAQPGFISSHLHRSHDLARVINYIQWRDAAAHEACMASAEVASGGPPPLKSSDFVPISVGQAVANPEKQGIQARLRLGHRRRDEPPPIGSTTAGTI